MEQFKRMANIYFLFMTIISWLIDSPVSPMTALVPLVFVIGVAAAKQGYEDIQRHKSDNKVNRTKATLIQNGKEKQIQSQYIAPGDLVLVKRDWDVPCDLVLLQSSDPHGKCYINTANLDGESNLKTLMVPRELPAVGLEAMTSLGRIECEHAKTDLYSFNGKIELSSSEGLVLPLTAENVLLRGSRVKNTESIIGCAVYTGMNTKLQLNSRHTRNKFASSEIYLNRFLIFNLILMFGICALLYFLKNRAEVTIIPDMEYVGTTVNIHAFSQFFQDFFSFLVLFKYLVPISMYVIVEMCRVMAGQFMRWDLHLYDEATDQPCMVNATNLNEELGQINILFSDKTGTLTKNEMIFQQCSIVGRKYHYHQTQLEEEGTKNVIDYNMFNVNQRNFFQALAICHTVQVAGDIQGSSYENGISNVGTARESMNGDSKKNISNSTGKASNGTEATAFDESQAPSDFQKQIERTIKTLDYQSSSADEKALIEACANLGLVYTGGDDKQLKIRIVDPHKNSTDEIVFEKLHTLEFTSERRRMSVIVKDASGVRWIYTKGAESCIFPLCNKESQELITITDDHITDFARLGLRTLAIARRKIGDDEYGEFLKELKEASFSLDNRNELNEMCYEKMEKDLDLLGATAVEDALQDDVADTLTSLKRAGIKTWVLTGDKMETALNIAISCGHITPNALKYFITECSSKEDMLDHLDNLDYHMKFARNKDFALLIDGKSLAVALNETSNEFRDLTIKCDAVLCCRLSPLQKSKVVALIKSSPENFITAAIGDGANDVSMIQEAHVGIGVMGKEGHQAAQCADFAFGKFYMLKRLLLVHGHYNSVRLAMMILYFFYKGIFLMGVMFIFQFYTLFSTTSAFDSLPMTLYNVIYTTLPMFILSQTEKPYPQEMLLSQPELYKKISKNKPLHWTPFFAWNLSGIYHAVICFYFAWCIFSVNDVILNVGQTADLASLCALLMHVVILVEHLKLWLETKYQSYWFIFSTFFSILVYIGTMVLYGSFNINHDTDLYWTYNKVLVSIPAWLYSILTTVACLLPDFTINIAIKGLNLHQRCLKRGKDISS
uniref:Phospholipid-transporting ATPase n=1 Tax=Stomoxys calcitrans TaxID=35570 RepID=A0A1I8NPP0_STOCA